MKPVYQSRKFWTAIITAVAMVVAHRYSPELAKLIAAVGSVLVAGFGLEDHGKAAASVAAVEPAPEVAPTTEVASGDGA